MTPAQALHAAARRYCFGQAEIWQQRADHLLTEPSALSHPDRQQHRRDHFARAQVLLLIGHHIERLDPDQLPPLERTRRHLLQVGRTAQPQPPRTNMGLAQPVNWQTFLPTAVTAAAQQQERDQFETYLHRLTPAQLAEVPPLPYRRVLSPAESDVLWVRLRQRWQIVGNRWYPLTRRPVEGTLPVEAFQVDAFEAAFSSAALVDLLHQRGVGRIWELREFGLEYAQDCSLLEPTYSNYEGYWSAEPLDWILYASHEVSITVGGWLLAAVQQQWPTWSQHRWF